MSAEVRWHLSQYLHCLKWMPNYSLAALTDDLIAAVVVTIMLVPQSLAYALLAGLPVEVGLYASMTPLIVYTFFGTSRALSVGPVAIVSLMTAAAIGEIAAEGSVGYLQAAMMLALLSGIFLFVLGLFKLGFIANFLSHPVIAGFIAASAITIGVSQLRHILGVEASGQNLVETGESLLSNIQATNPVTLAIGISTVAFLMLTRRSVSRLLIQFSLGGRLSDLLSKTGPIAAVVLSIVLVQSFNLDAFGVAIVGNVPPGLPRFIMPSVDMALIQQLLVPAALIATIGFVESISVAQTLAAKKRQSIDPDQELVSLGLANLATGMTGGYPVTGGFARSVVNYEAGANTQAAGAFAGIGIVFVTMYLTHWLQNLPKAVLAATIIVAVLTLIDTETIKRTWRYSKVDGTAMMITILVTLLAGVELGVISGVVASLTLHLYRTSRPHTAVVGRVPGTEHFRNINRHDVVTHPEIISLRVDESLYFANARFLEEEICELIDNNRKAQHFVLMCSAVNMIDASALESLEVINDRLKGAAIGFHLSEVKGPVMDRLKRVNFFEALNGEVFLSQHDAEKALIARVAASGQDAVEAERVA